MPKNDTTLLVPYNTTIDSTIRISIVSIDGGIRIATNKTLTLNNFCTQ